MIVEHGKNDANIANDKDAIHDIVDMNNGDFADGRKAWTLQTVLFATTARTVHTKMRQSTRPTALIVQTMRSALIV